MHRGSTSIGLVVTAAVVAVLGISTAARAADPPGAIPDTAANAGAAAGPAATGPAAAAAEPQQPMQVSADTAEYFNKEGRVLFTGSVVVHQADSTITADTMEVTFDQPPPAEGKAASGLGAPANAQRIKMIVARDKVSFRQVDAETGKERYATGDKGVYDVEKRFVTMTGNPRLWEGKNVIVGEEMQFDLVEKKVVVKGKVNLTLFPEDLKEGKKP